MATVWIRFWFWCVWFATWIRLVDKCRCTKDLTPVSGLSTATSARRVSHPSTTSASIWGCTPTTDRIGVTVAPKRSDSRSIFGNNPLDFSRPFDMIHVQFDSVRAHSFTHRLQDEPVTCPVCQKVFRNKILLSSHKRIHKIAKSGAASQSDVTVLNQETQPCWTNTFQLFLLLQSFGNHHHRHHHHHHHHHHQNMMESSEGSHSNFHFGSLTRGKCNIKGLKLLLTVTELKPWC